MQREETAVPPASAWLGGLGAVPFVILAATQLGLDGQPRAVVIQALLSYGSVILSFLGGIHWGMAIAPRATPANVVSRISTDIAKVLAEPDVIEKFRSFGLEPATATAAQIAEMTKNELVQNAELVKRAGIKPE